MDSTDQTPARQYVINASEVAPGWLGLYVVTFAIETVCGAIRAFVAYPLIWLAFTVAGVSTSYAHPLALLAGYGPLVLSVATLVLPIGGWMWTARSGGRAPSERERLIYEDALAELTAVNPSLRPPRDWFVLDDSAVNAAAYADRLMVTRGLLESGEIQAVLAHELGHLNSTDARLTAAVYRMTTPPRRRPPFPLRTLGFVVTGALGMWVTRPAWSAYWRAREFQADAYAANLGQGPALARFLDGYALQNDLPIPFVWLSDASHPWTEHRIDHLEATQQ